MSNQRTPGTMYLPPTYLAYDSQLLYTEALPEPPPADPLTDVTQPEFWEQDTININRALARYQSMRTREVTIDDLRDFAAETIRLVLHLRHILREVATTAIANTMQPYHQPVYRNWQAPRERAGQREPIPLFPHMKLEIAPAPPQPQPQHDCSWHNCPSQAKFSIYDRLGDQYLPDDVPPATRYACSRHQRTVARYCHASDTDITPLNASELSSF